ncbi:MAG TPA: DoxX family protein [Rhizomicrobium sp.]|nr:DoxX family protein [Rhizomicrobium sp.]
MTIAGIEDFVAYGLAVLFAVAGLINLTGISRVRAAYRFWQYPKQFYRSVGTLELLVSLFLAVPQLRIWGVLLGGFISFFAVVTLLNHRQYALSIPGMLLLVTLVPAALAHG